MTTVGVDLAGSTARAVAVHESGRTLSSGTCTRGDLQTVLQQMIDALPAGEQPVAGGIAVDRVTAEAAEDVCRYPLPVPVHVVQAGAAAVAAEQHYGAARGAQHAVCLWVADTVHAGLLLEGRPWSGAHGMSGAAAWLALNPVERQDYRRFGSLAAEVSHAGVARRLVWRLQTGDTSSALERAGTLEAVTAAHVFAAARDGDAVATSVVRDTARYIGMAAANLAAIVDPELIVICGLAPGTGDLLIDSVVREAGRRLPAALVERFRCELSPLGEEGIAIGAARLAALTAA